MLKNRFDVLLFVVSICFVLQLPNANAQVRRIFQSPQPAYQPQSYPQQTYQPQAFPQQTYPQQTYPQQSFPQQSFPQQQTFPQQQVQQFPQGNPVQPQVPTPALQPQPQVPAPTRQTSPYDGDIREQLNKTRAKLGRYSSQLRLLIKNNDELKDRNKKLEAAVIKRNKIIESRTDPADEAAALAKEEIARLKQVVETSEAEQRRLEDSYKTQDDVVAQLKNANVKLKEQVALADEQNKALENLKQQLTRSQNDGSAMSQRLQDAQQRLANMANPTPDSETDELKRQLEMVSKEKESLAMQLKEAQENKLDMSDLETNEDAPNLVDGTILQKEIDRLETINSKMRQQYQAAMQQESDLKSRIETLSVENQQAQDRVRELSSQLAEANTRVVPSGTSAMNGDFQPRVEPVPAVVTKLKSDPSPAPRPVRRVATRVVPRAGQTVAKMPVVAPVAIESDVDELDSPVAAIVPVAKPSAVVSAVNGSWLGGKGSAKYWVLGLILTGLAIGLSVAYAESLEGEGSSQTRRASSLLDKDSSQPRRGPSQPGRGPSQPGRDPLSEN